MVDIFAQEIDDLVEEWTPEPLVGKTTAFEDAELEKRAVIVGYASRKDGLCGNDWLICADRLDHDRNSQTVEP